MVFIGVSDPILCGISNDGDWKVGWTFCISVLCRRISPYKIDAGTDRLGQTDGEKDGHYQSDQRKGMVQWIRLVVRRRRQIFRWIFRGRAEVLVVGEAVAPGRLK